MNLFDALKQYLSDAAPGGSLNPEVTPQGLLDVAAMASTPVPVVGDVLGLAADAKRLYDNPKERTAMNYGMSALGLLPFVPAMGSIKSVQAPRAEAMETARKNAVEMLGLPPNNTAMDRAKALGFEDDTYHGTFNRFDNFDMAKANPRSQYMPGIFTADRPELAENFGDYIMPLMQRKGTTVLDKRKARNNGLPLPEVDTIHDKATGVRVTNNPLNIRSRFAAFDPARVNENDLLGRADPRLLGLMGVLGAGGLGGAYLYNRDKK